MDTGCSDAESSSSHGVSWSNLTTPCCVQGSRQMHYSRSHDLQNENVLLLVIFQTYGVSSRHDGHSYVCSMGLWFLLRTVCCNCCKRSDTQHSLLCSLCSVSVLQWPQKMTSQCHQRLSFCSIDIFFLPQGRHSPVWLSSSEFGLSRARTRKSRRILGRLKAMTGLLW